MTIASFKKIITFTYNFRQCLNWLSGIVHSKPFFLLVINTFIACLTFAQVPATTPNSTTEQQLEAITENSEDAEMQDDTFLQNLQQFAKSPINLNTADALILKELVVLTPLQIQNFISYRNLFGSFLSLYEIQAIPNWDVATIEKIRPYITVQQQTNLLVSFSERMHGGSNSIVARVTQVVEPAKGFLIDPATTANYYQGAQQRYFVRYKYQYKNLMQFGLVAEKDAGEQFFKGSQKQGFDFYSPHVFIRNVGVIKAIALGDFTVNLGQGLIQWQSLAFKKSPDVTNIKRQLAILRPYNSAGEANFHRGAGITIAKKNIEATAFISFKNIDANFVADTATNQDFITSIGTSGLHRTASEVADKAIQQQLTYGGNITFNKNNFHVGVNAVQYQFKLPIIKSNDPYNLYALHGKSAGNTSVDYSYTFKNMHFFGELAADNNKNIASVNGLMISVDATVDMSFLYRSISKKYQSLYTNAFTESTFPNNESGIFSGISIKPNNFWRIDAYADFYKFPWLRFLTDAPSVGVDYFTQITYKPNKQLEIYARYRAESRARNFNYNDIARVDPVLTRPRQNFRSQISYKLDKEFTVRNRVEMSWFDKKGNGAQNGFLTYVDFIYKPMMKKYAGNCRLLYFDTDGYDSRLYAYENDVLYSFSIPVFYDKGYRYYINVNYDFSKKLSVWCRIAQTVFANKNTVGSGLDEIKGNRRTEIKLQAQYYF